VGIETQARYLAKKPTWTRKMVLVTDGENPMEIEDWEATVSKMNDLDIQMSIMWVSDVTTLITSNVYLKWCGLRR